MNGASSQDEVSAEEMRLNEMDGRDPNFHSEIQDNLSHASHGLTDALHRLQHLRNSLAELTGRSNQAVGPDHAAIVFSHTTGENDNAVPDMQRLRSTIPSAIMERLEEYEAVSRYDVDSVGRGFSSGTLHTTTSRQPSGNPLLAFPSTQTTASRTRSTYRAPPFPDLVLPARRLSRYRDTNPDDGSTVLGRRVAARAAAGGGIPSENSMSQLDQIFLSRTTEIARDLESAMNRITSHTARLEQRTNQALPNASSLVSNTISGGAAQTNEDAASDRIVVSIPSRPANSTRRWRFGQTTGGTDLQLPGASELANATQPNPNESTVTTTLGPRPRQIPRDERDSVSSAGTAHEREVDHRNYIIRRSLNADGDEQVHSLTMTHWDGDGDDDPMEWLMPPVTVPGQDHQDAQVAASTVSRNPSFYSSTRLHSGQGPAIGYGSYTRADPDDVSESTLPDVPRRRRGWARLDADGNEIPTEAEDEIERVRAQVRVRALTQIRASATRTRSTLESGVARRGTLTPMTRTSITHVWDDNEGVTARVRLNAPQQTVISPSTDDINGILSETHTSDLVPQTGSINRPRRSCDTFVADPLPMPLADMVTRLPTLHKPYPRTVIVHKYANLAGR